MRKSNYAGLKSNCAGLKKPKLLPMNTPKGRATEQAEAKQNRAEAERLIAENTEKQRALDARTAKFKSGLLELRRELGSDGDKLSVPPFTEGELQALEHAQ